MTITKKQLADAVLADVRAEMGWDAPQEWQLRTVPDQDTPEELGQVTALQALWTALSIRTWGINALDEDIQARASARVTAEWKTLQTAEGIAARVGGQKG
jgi:hypothetical protein